MQGSIKISVEHPISLKEQMKQMMNFQEQDDYFTKSMKNARVHRNLFFGLMYFHAIVTNRNNYGIIGWNIPYYF